MILASTSKYRAELLNRLGLPFQALKPSFDEEAHKNAKSAPLELALFLAEKKAESLATPDNCVIGGDQLVFFKGQKLGKSHTREKAMEQLLEMQGQTHSLLTAVCVIYKNQKTIFHDETVMKMRQLTQEEIGIYLDLDEPYDCAGSYKIERAGILLFDEIKTKDMTAIQGLPLVQLAQVLKKHGYKLP